MRKPSAIVDARPNKTGFTGRCTQCGKTASKEAHFSREDVVVIEKYCIECSQPVNLERLQAWYSRF